MPNNIKNRLEIIGSDNQVKEIRDFLKGEPFDDGTPMVIDFNKIIPMPKGLEANPHSGIETWLEICTGKLDFQSAFKDALGGKSYGDVWTQNKENGFNKMMNYMSSTAAIETLMGKRGKNIANFDDAEFDIFIQCLKNHRQYGYFSWHGWSNKNWGTKWNAYSQKEEAKNTLIFETAWAGVVDLMESLSKKFPDIKLFYEWADEDTGSNCGQCEYLNGIIKLNKFESGSDDAYELAFKLDPEAKNSYKKVNGKYEYTES
jgi:hypothetical protein